MLNYWYKNSKEFYSKHTKGVITFLCWLLPVLVLLLYYALRGVYPFGDGTILAGDLGTQYIDLFKYYKETILYDHTAFTYSFEQSLGGEMLSTWGYYLMSPFNLILLLFPEKLFPVAMWVLVISKVSCSSLTFGYVLQNKFKQSNIATVFFSLSYCLMSYVTVYMTNILWLDGIIWLPLIVYGIERLVKDKNPFMYILSLAILLISNYYIGYMVCIFSVLYFLYVKYTQEHSGGIKNYKLFFKDVVRFGFASLLAALLGAFILVPTFNALLVGKLNSVNVSKPELWIHNPLDFVYRLLMGTFNYSSNIVHDYPNIFVGTIVALGFFTFFFNEGIPQKQKIGVAVLSIFLLLSMSIGILDLAWHAFKLPIGFAHRYSFLFSFIMCYFGYQSFISKVKYTSSELHWFFCMYTFFAGYTLFFVESINLIGKICLGVSVVLFILLWLFYKLQKNHKNSGLLLLFVVLEMSINTAVNSLYSDYPIASQYNEVDNYMVELTEWFDTNDNSSSFYRLEKTFNRSLDDSFTFHYNGINNFNSNIDQGLVSLLYDLGDSSFNVFVAYAGGTPVTDAFFGLDYYVDLKETSSMYDNETLSHNPRPDLQLYSKVSETENFNIYKNPYALSLGFGVNNKFLTNDYRSKKYIDLNNSLLSAVADEDVNAFTKEKIHYYVGKDEITDLEYRVTENPELSFNLGKETTGLHYLYLPTYSLKNTRIGWSVTSTNTVIETSGLVLNIDGTKDYNSNLKSKEDIYNLYPYFYTLNESTFSDAFEKVQGNEFIIDNYTNSKVIGHTESTFSRETLMFTIPYSKDWVVRVDGKVVETKKVYDTFLAIGLGAGEHEVELEYKVTYLWVGFAISGISFVGLMTWYVLHKKYIKNKDQDESEG